MNSFQCNHLWHTLHSFSWSTYNEGEHRCINLSYVSSSAAAIQIEPFIIVVKWLFHLLVSCLLPYIRLIVECRHSPTAHVSVGYLVKTPSLGPSIQAPGVFGVQLRISKGTLFLEGSGVRFILNFVVLCREILCLQSSAICPPDENYTDYYPQYHRPLSSLLKQPLYLEVHLLNPPDDNVVLLVHYCLAYPRSAQAAWVLIYDG